MAVDVRGGATPELAVSLGHLAGIASPSTPVQSANSWAGWNVAKFGYLELVAALNLKAGNDSTTLAKMPKELDGVCNQLAGTTGLPAQAAMAVMAFGPAGSGDTWASETQTWAQSSETWANA